MIWNRRHLDWQSLAQQKDAKLCCGISRSVTIFQVSFFSALGCTFPLCLRSSLYRDNDCNHPEAPTNNYKPPGTTSNQPKPGNDNHYSLSVLVVPQSGIFVPKFPAVFKNWCQIFSAPNFPIPISQVAILIYTVFRAFVGAILTCHSFFPFRWGGCVNSSQCTTTKVAAGLDMAAALGVVPAAMEDGPCKKRYYTPPVRPVGKSSRAWPSSGWLPGSGLCVPLPCAALPGLVEHRHLCKSPQRCWGWFWPVAGREPGTAVIS